MPVGSWARALHAARRIALASAEQALPDGLHVQPEASRWRVYSRHKRRTAREAARVPGALRAWRSAVVIAVVITIRIRKSPPLHFIQKYRFCSGMQSGHRDCSGPRGGTCWAWPASVRPACGWLVTLLGHSGTVGLPGWPAVMPAPKGMVEGSPKPVTKLQNVKNQWGKSDLVKKPLPRVRNSPPGRPVTRVKRLT